MKSEGYKKYLLKSDRIKLLLYFNFPKQYVKMQRKEIVN